MRIIRVAATTAFLLFTTACDGSGDTRPSESTPTDNSAAAGANLLDSCGLVAQEDVDAIFGGSSPTAAPGEVSGSGESRCNPVEGLGDEAWAGETDKRHEGALLAVSVDGSGARAQAIGPDATVDQLVPLATGGISGLS